MARGDTADALERWAAEARAQDAADARARERWLRQQADDEATLSGLLVDLAERGDTVVVATREGRHHQGKLTVVGTDFVAVRTSSGALALVALASLAFVRGGQRRRPGQRDADADGEQPRVTLADVLAHMAADRPRVAMQVGDLRLVGDMVAVGTDVVTLRTDGDPPATGAVPLPSVSEVYLLDSG